MFFSLRNFSTGFNAAKEKLEIVSGAAPPPFGIFAGGFPRRRRRRNAFGLIQEYCTIHNLVGKFSRALARGEEKGVVEIRIGLAGKCEFGGQAK